MLFWKLATVSWSGAGGRRCWCEGAERDTAREGWGLLKIPRRDIDGVGCESGGHKREGDEGRMLGWKFATVSWSGAGGLRC